MVIVVKGTEVGLCLLCRKVKLMLRFIVIDSVTSSPCAQGMQYMQSTLAISLAQEINMPSNPLQNIKN